MKTWWSVCFSWRTFTSRFWCAFCISVITTFSITFRVSVRWTCRRTWTRSSLPIAFLVWFMFECARISKWTLAFCSPTHISSLRAVFFAFSLLFPFCFTSAQSSYCRSVLVSIPRFEMRIPWFSARGVFGPLTQVCNNRISCRQMSSPKAWTLSFFYWAFNKSLKYKMACFIVATNFEQVVDHPCKLSARKWSLPRLSFAFGCGDKPPDVSC